MRPNTTARSQLHLASMRSSTENLCSPVRQVTSILTPWASIVQEDEIRDQSSYNGEQCIAGMDHVLNEGAGNNLGNNVSDHQGDNPSKPKANTQSGIASMVQMLEEQCVMLNMPSNRILCCECRVPNR